MKIRKEAIKKKMGRRPVKAVNFNPSTVGLPLCPLDGESEPTAENSSYSLTAVYDNCVQLATPAQYVDNGDGTFTLISVTTKSKAIDMKKKMGRRPVKAVNFNPCLGWVRCQCGGKMLVYSSPPAKNGVKTRYHRCPFCGARVKSEERL